MSVVTQRTDYTFKYNQTQSRHGWLRLTPAYSVKLVQEIVNHLEPNRLHPRVILDPFSGTATTGLAAAQNDFTARLYDINPFLIWLGNAKCRHYTEDEISTIAQQIPQIIQAYKQYLPQSSWQPAIHNIHRWWAPATLNILTAMRQAIVDTGGEPGEYPATDLLWIAFCRLVIETSAAAFNHVSLSFHDETTSFVTQTIDLFFSEVAHHILAEAGETIYGEATVEYADSRYPLPQLSFRKYTDVITSPPYPNRVSYIRELRPYMYWTKFLREAREAGELDWTAIGGTWGIATSRLKTWQPELDMLPDAVYQTCAAIAQSDNKNAFLMSRYVHKYFHDMHQHFASLRFSLASGANLHYIVGNSTFYGIRVNTEQLLGDSLSQLGYSDIACRVVRKRNSKKELYEFCLSAKWNE
ncbi:MAG: DNA methyltransferase [Chloroflexi bacterium]|nr:DNA methyltransferase [Chloroflexota bacterium]